MLYLHCGAPRTSTSSLQAALFGCRDQLAAAGVVYPGRWLSPQSPTHHRISALLRASLDSKGSLDDFKRFLETHSDRDVLISAEVLTLWLPVSNRRQAFLAFLSAAREVTPTRCIWTLRRFDEALTSLYLMRLASGARLSPPAVHFRNLEVADEMFAGLRAVEAAAGSDVVYVKYDATGTHNSELLSAFGFAGGLADLVREKLEREPRLNASLSHKQAVAILSLDALSVRTGAELDAAALRRAFSSAGFRFEEDWRCQLTDAPARRAIHERALAAANKQGLFSYVEFFEDTEVDMRPWPGLDPEILTDVDLERLIAAVR